jgi:hypothetical protein
MKRIFSVAGLLVLVGATSAGAIAAKSQPARADEGVKLVAAGMQVDAVAPRVASLDRPL